MEKLDRPMALDGHWQLKLYSLFWWEGVIRMTSRTRVKRPIYEEENRKEKYQQNETVFYKNGYKSK